MLLRILTPFCTSRTTRVYTAPTALPAHGISLPGQDESTQAKGSKGMQEPPASSPESVTFAPFSPLAFFLGAMPPAVRCSALEGILSLSTVTLDRDRTKIAVSQTATSLNSNLPEKKLFGYRVPGTTAPSCASLLELEGRQMPGRGAWSTA